MSKTARVGSKLRQFGEQGGELGGGRALRVESLRAAFYVGDTAYDVTSARTAGYTTVSIGGGYQHSSVLAGARPDHHIEDLAAMLDLSRPRRRRRPERALSLEQPAAVSR